MPYILREEPPNLSALLRLLQSTLTKMNASKFEVQNSTGLTQVIMEPLVQTFHHPQPEVRKSIVFCIV